LLWFRSVPCTGTKVRSRVDSAWHLNVFRSQSRGQRAN
jgi:hypothetical protein